MHHREREKKSDKRQLIIEKKKKRNGRKIPNLLHIQEHTIRNTKNQDDRTILIN